MKKILLLLAIILLFPISALAQETEFAATVIEARENFIRVEDDAGKRFTIDRTVDVSGLQSVVPGNKVKVANILRKDGTEQFVIVDFVRYPWLIVLIILFIVVMIALNKKHGLKSLLNIGVMGIIVFFGIIPLILKGWSPVAVTVLGGTLAMLVSIYISYGINKKSHSAILSIALGLLATGILSAIAIRLVSLTGFVTEEATFLVAMGYEHINIRGLLLAAIMIGALGVFDDLAISQASVVEELHKANPNMNKKDLFTSALRVGQDHTSAMVNTLIFAYLGAAFPLVLLIAIGETPFDSLAGILNHETVATELVRTLIGTLIILLLMPIATIIPTALLFRKK